MHWHWQLLSQRNHWIFVRCNKDGSSQQAKTCNTPPSSSVSTLSHSFDMCSVADFLLLYHLSSLSERKATICKSDQQLIEDMLNSVAYDAVDAPTIHEPISQMSYDQQVLEASVLSLSCVERYQLNNIYNFGQWLLLARQAFNTAKESKNLIFWSNNFVDWLEERMLQSVCWEVSYNISNDVFCVHALLLSGDPGYIPDKTHYTTSPTHSLAYGNSAMGVYSYILR